MLKEIDSLKKKYRDDNIDELQNSAALQQDSTALFYLIGSRAWPEVNSQTWECVDSELYPRPLRYFDESDDREM